MTMTDTTPLDVRGLTDAELLDLARSDGTAAAKALAEAGRGDRDDQLARGRRALADIRAEGDRQAYAQYRAADTDCRGELLSREGKAAFTRGEILSELDLWRIPEDRARRYASWELTDFWDASPRVTSGDYVRQQAREHRAAEDDRKSTRLNSSHL